MGEARRGSYALPLCLKTGTCCNCYKLLYRYMPFQRGAGDDPSQQKESSHGYASPTRGAVA